MSTLFNPTDIVYIQKLSAFNNQQICEAGTFLSLCVSLPFFSLYRHNILHPSRPFFSSISRFCYRLHSGDLTHVTDPHLRKVTHKDSNYQRGIEAGSAAQSGGLQKITQQ